MAANNNKYQKKQNYQKNNGNGDQYRKKSGCKKGLNNGEVWISGWNKSQNRGFISFVAGPYSKTKRTASQNGIEWENWLVRLSYPHGEKLMNGMYEVGTGRLIIRELKMIANPKQDYFGSYIRRN